MLGLPKHTADSYGFPRTPRPGQRFTYRGIVFQFFESSNGLGELGFWGAVLSLGASAISSLFGGGKSKEQLKQAEQALLEQQARIKQLEQQLEKKSQGLNITKFFKKNPLMTAGVIILILHVVSKK